MSDTPQTAFVSRMSRRSAVLTVGFLPLLATPVAGIAQVAVQDPDTLDAQLNIVRDRAIAYFDRIVRVTTDTPPPGINAANGWFREAMVVDQIIKDNFALSPDVTLPEPLMVGVSLNQVGQAVVDGFAPANHRASAATYFPLTKQALVDFGPLISQIVGEIVGVVASGGTVSVAVAAKIATDVKALSDKVQGYGYKYDGTHANGYIQEAVKATAGRARVGMQNRSSSIVSAKGKQITGVLQSYLDHLIAMRTRNMDPWLDAAWQLEFLAIAEASAAAMRLA